MVFNFVPPYNGSDSLPLSKRTLLYLRNMADSLRHGKREIPVLIGIATMLTADLREELYVAAKGLSHKSTILEIGCYAGGSTYFLGKGAIISDSHVFSIDPFRSSIEKQEMNGDGSNYFEHLSSKPSKQEVEAMLRYHKLEDRVTLIEGFSTEVVRGWDHRKISFFFIDGNHRQARSDYDAWKPHLAPHALIAFDDSNYPLGKELVTRDVHGIIRSEPVTLIKRIGKLTVLQLT